MSKNRSGGTSLAVQWLRLCASWWGTKIQKQYERGEEGGCCPPLQVEFPLDWPFLWGEGTERQLTEETAQLYQAGTPKGLELQGLPDKHRI